MNKDGYQVTVPAAYAGVAFLFSWTYLMFYASTAGIEAAAPISLMGASYTISAACMAVTILAIAFARIDRGAFLTRPSVKASTGLMTAVGSTALVAGGLADNVALIIAGGVVTGVFSGIMCQQWVLAYQRIGLRVAANSFPMLMAASVGICATLMYLPGDVLLVATIACPVISELMFHAVRNETWPVFEEEEADLKDRPINFVLLLLPVAVFALSSGFLDFSSVDNGYTFAFYAFGAFVPVAIAGIFSFMADRQSFVGVFVVPAAVLVAVCVPFLASPNLTPLSPFISIGELGIEVLLFIVSVGFAQFFSLDALKAYALAKTANALFNGLGWYAALAADRATGLVLHAQMSLVAIFLGVEVLVVCLIVAIVKARKSLPIDDAELRDGRTDEPAAEDTAPLEERAQAEAHANLQGRAGGEHEAEAGAVSATTLTAASEGARGEASMGFEAAAASIGDEGGLSEREREVFMLLARGYTSPRIQKELYIAAGTVNYHSRNIYAKLGVHSKQELIALVESRLV